MTTNLQPLASDFISEISELIHASKNKVALTVNAELTLLYWHIGERIHHEVLNGERADYGRKIIKALSKSLTQQFGKGWSSRNLFQMLKFYQVFPNIQIVQTLSALLSWSHFVQLSTVENPLARDFYATMASQERWSVRTLENRIGSLLFERTALSKTPNEMIAIELENLRETGNFQPSILLKDPYVLDFLELNDHYLEKDLEDAILRDIEQFLLEMGAGFSFIARQKHIIIDEDDFYIDLLFYNRKLKRLVAIDLKTEKFNHAHKSQMELYLRYLAKYEQEPDENPPLGIILCTSKKDEQIELLGLNEGEVHVAEYLTVLPPKALLEERLHLAVEKAKQRFN